MDILVVDLRNINLDDVSFDEDDPKTIMSELWIGKIDLNKVKHFKKK